MIRPVLRVYRLRSRSSSLSHLAFSSLLFPSPPFFTTRENCSLRGASARAANDASGDVLTGTNYSAGYRARVYLRSMPRHRTMKKIASERRSFLPRSRWITVPFDPFEEPRAGYCVSLISNVRENTHTHTWRMRSARMCVVTRRWL